MDLEWYQACYTATGGQSVTKKKTKKKQKKNKGKPPPGPTAASACHLRTPDDDGMVVRLTSVGHSDPYQ
jgi:hypothetical protein